VDGRRAAIELVALPEQQDLRAQLGLDPGAILGGQHALVEVAQERRDRGQLVAGRAAEHLGRMRGEHERQLDLGDAQGSLGRQRLERAAQRRLAAQRALAPAPFPMELLGEVHHLKVQAERANDVDRVLAREALEDGIDLAIDRLARRGAPFAGQRAQPFDRGEGRRPRVRAQRVADEPPEQRHLHAQRRRRVGRRRGGAHRTMLRDGGHRCVAASARIRST
jgi:hypothetical protein